MLAMEEPGTVGAEALSKQSRNSEKYPDIELEIEEVAHEPFHANFRSWRSPNNFLILFYYGPVNALVMFLLPD